MGRGTLKSLLATDVQLLYFLPSFPSVFLVEGNGVYVREVCVYVFVWSVCVMCIWFVFVFCIIVCVYVHYRNVVSVCAMCV